MEKSVSKESFECDRYCGKCCKDLAVQLDKIEIKKIENLRYKKEDFLEGDLLPFNKFILKRGNDGCVFLKTNTKGYNSCKIYEFRPKICRQYPFFIKKKLIKSCKPKDLFPDAFKGLLKPVKDK